MGYTDGCQCTVQELSVRLLLVLIGYKVFPAFDSSLVSLNFFTFAFTKYTLLWVQQKWGLLVRSVIEFTNQRPIFLHGSIFLVYYDVLHLQGLIPYMSCRSSSLC